MRGGSPRAQGGALILALAAATVAATGCHDWEALSSALDGAAPDGPAPDGAAFDSAGGDASEPADLTGAPASCRNGSRDGDESDVDCGGSCGPCANGRACLAGSDCASRTCLAGKCYPLTCADRQKNLRETDTDCGGGDCPPCDDGRGCVQNIDCRSMRCTPLNRCGPV